MSLVVHVPDELARRLAEVAEARHQAPEEFALEAIENQLPARRRLGFSGVGASGIAGSDLARRHREVRAESFASLSARDV
jgi:DNA-binding MurR/RpiR family transcriptional regulator